MAIAVLFASAAPASPTRLVLDALGAGVSPALVWGLVPRFVGVIYLLAFAGLLPQVRGLVGSRGIAPVREQLAAAREHFPGPGRFLRWPTLFWINASDAAVRLVPLAGIAAALLAIHGGPSTTAALVACYVLLLSLDVAGVIFPWDCMALEAGVLALFLPAPPALPEVATTVLPEPIVAFVWRLFLVRVMWGFARVKFVGTKPGDSIYLKGFFGAMPLVTPVGHWCYRLPDPVLRAMYGCMWFAEVVCPGLTLFGGAPRVIGALGLMGLMAGIAATGNWGWFNLGYAALCVVFLDARGSVLDAPLARWFASPGAAALHATMVLLALLGLFYFAAATSWVTHIVPRLPFEEGNPRWSPLRALMALLRAVAPLRVVHGYGVFPPNSRAPLKAVPVFEGSNDGIHFQPYEYRYASSHDRSPPRVVAPHHPRVDHLTVYPAYGITGSDYLVFAADGNRVYGFSPFAHHSWLDRTAQRLLEGEPAVLALFARHPFAQPPRYVRVMLRALWPADSPAEIARGVYWKVHDLGVLFPARESDPGIWQRWLPPPEMFHPELVPWRRAGPALSVMAAAHASGAEPDAAVRVASDLRADEVAAFWDDFVPHVARGRGDVAQVDAVARDVRERFGRDACVRFERLAERFAHLLRLHLEPELIHGQKPLAVIKASFRFYLLLHEIILDGRDAYLRALGEPAAAARERMARQTDASALHFICVLRNEVIHAHARAFRHAAALRTAKEPDLPGLWEFRELLRAEVRGGDEWLPVTTCKEGKWTIEGFERVAAPARAAREPKDHAAA